MSKPKSPCFNLIVCCENEFLPRVILFAKRLVQIKTNIRYTLTCFSYQFIYLISLSNAVNFLHSLLVLEIMICHKL